MKNYLFKFMKKNFTIIFLLFSQVVFAQSFDELQKKLDFALATYDYENSLKYAKLITPQAKKEFGEYSLDYAVALTNQSFLSMQLQQYDMVENDCLHAIIILDKLEADSTYFINVYNNLSNYYNKINYFEKSKYYTQKTIEYYKNIQDLESYYVAQLNLAEIYRQTEQYNLAIKQYDNYLDKIKLLSIDYYVYYLNNYGLTYYYYGNYQKAKQIYLQALEIIDQQNLQSDNYINDILNNLACACSSLGEADKKEEYLIKAVNSFEKLYGRQSPSFLTAANNLATYYNEKNDFATALKMLINLYYICTNNKISDINFAAICSNLGYTNMCLGNINSAIFYYNKGLTVLDNLISPNTIMYQAQKLCLADLYITKKNKKKKGIQLFSESLNILNTSVFNNSLYLPENEKQIMMQSYEKYYNELMSLIYFNPENKELQEVGLNFVLNYKYKLLDVSKTTKNFISLNNDSIKNEILNNYYSARLDYSKAIFHNLDAVTISQKELTVLDLENKLIKQLSNQEFKKIELLNQPNLDWHQIQNKLSDDEAVIEYFNFTVYDNLRWLNNVIYAAFVITKNSEPVLIRLCQKKDLQTFLNTKNEFHFTFIPKLYENSLNEESKSDSLYNFIFKPLEDKLRGISKLNIVSSGILYQFSFSALNYYDTAYLADKYIIKQLTSSREILNKNKFDFSTNLTTALWGGINYSEKNNNDTINESKFFVDNQIYKSFDNKFKDLKMSLPEITNIKDTLFKKGIVSQMFTGKDATVESFFQFNKQSPNIMHLSTHGLYAKYESNMDYNTKLNLNNITNPLCRSILAFAGAKKHFSKDSITTENNCILSAYDISQMDLSNTNLIVLSACQTALGDVEGDEVFGLQRAFVMSGVKTMIITLWNIRDDVGYYFMTTLYS